MKFPIRRLYLKIRYRLRLSPITRRRLSHWLKYQELIFTVCSLLIYGVLIFEQLTVFPCYFFCDEAINGVEAYGLLTGTHYSQRIGILWPKFFQGFGDYDLALSVYLAVPFVKLFGLNEFAVRFAIAVNSLIGVGAVYILVRFIFKLPLAWLTFVVFAISPVWFVHSRTGFIIILPVSFFLSFGACYILAFSRHPFFGVPAAIFGVATFYCYTSARGWIMIALLLLLLVNFKRHLQHWKTTLISSLLLIVLLGPYIHLQLTHPEIAMKRFSSLRNYAAVTQQSLTQRGQTILSNYAMGVNPVYWYSWEKALQPRTPERHVIPKLPHLFFWTLPFMIVGFGISIWHIRRFEYRTLIALLAAVPVPAALAEFNHLRVIAVGPLLLIFALIGIGWMDRLLKKFPVIQQCLSILLLVGLGLYAVWFRNYVYRKAIYGYTDYGFYGVQMGAPEVFRWINEHASEYAHILLSPDLFNAGNIFIPFYLRGETAQKTRTVDTTLLYKTRQAIPHNAVYILPIAFLTRLEQLHVPISVTRIDTIPDKRGAPLFRIVTLERAPEFDAWFTQNEQWRKQPQRHVVKRNNVEIIVGFPPTDLGSVPELFDGNRRSFVRTDQINPATITVRIPAATLSKIRIIIAHPSATVALNTTDVAGQTISWGNAAITNPEQYVYVHEFTAPTPALDVTFLSAIVHVTNADEYGHVHVEEIEWE